MHEALHTTQLTGGHNEALDTHDAAPRPIAVGLKDVRAPLQKMKKRQVLAVQFAGCVEVKVCLANEGMRELACLQPGYEGTCTLLLCIGLIREQELGTCANAVLRYACLCKT